MRNKSSKIQFTWLDFCRYYDNTITEEVAEYILWERTAFPMCDIRSTTYQIRKTLRAINNHIKICSCCGMSTKHHKQKCFYKKDCQKDATL